VIDAGSITVVLDAYRPERAALLDLLGGLGAEEWGRPTECPAYTVKGIATHVLGDDLSLLSRQRDGAEEGTTLLAAELPDAGLWDRLDVFNDRWVAAAAFLSTELLLELLRLAGEWTADFYARVDPEAPGEPVGLFGVTSGTSPFWHAIAREYMERWAHHSQIRRAVGLGSLADEPFLQVGVGVAAAAARVEPEVPAGPGGTWALGPLRLGGSQQTADILTRAHTAPEVQRLVGGPAAFVELFAAAAGRHVEER
jgi:uncharacterized protein (TIGR03083 family)